MNKNQIIYGVAALAAMLLLGKPSLRANDSALELLPDTLYNTAGETVSKEALKGKWVGIYFSASWCPPCRKFTPKLVAFRNAHKEDFEVILVSFDRGTAAQKKYMKKYSMPWLAVENGSDAGKALSKHYEASAIPILAIIAPDGRTITRDGRRDVTKQADKALDIWQSQLN